MFISADEAITDAGSGMMGIVEPIGRRRCRGGQLLRRQLLRSLSSAGVSPIAFHFPASAGPPLLGQACLRAAEDEPPPTPPLRSATSFHFPSRSCPSPSFAPRSPGRRYIWLRATMSHTPRCKLVDYFEELSKEEFKKFKMHLEDYQLEKGYKPIRRCKTETAGYIEIAQYMIEAYEDTKALKMTVNILDKINKKDLAARVRKEMAEYGCRRSKRRSSNFRFLSFIFKNKNDHLFLTDFLPKPSTMTKKERKEREEKIWSNLHDKFSGTAKKVEVMLDPKTAYPALILSEDRKSVHMGEQAQDLPDIPERFCSLPGVLGAEGIDSGTLEWVVEVGKAKDWAIGVARESVERKYLKDITVAQGFWVLQLAAEEYMASTNPPIKLTLWKSPRRILITLEHDFETLSFYNADSMKRIFTFNYPFSEKVFPFFLVRDKDTPLKISPMDSVQLDMERISFE